MKQINVELEIDEDESEDVTVHLFCDGMSAKLLHDEELDKLSKEKSLLEKRYDTLLDKEIEYEDTRTLVRGGGIGVIAMTALGICADMFQNWYIYAGWLGIVGTVGMIGYENSKKIKTNSEVLNSVQEKLDVAQKTYDDKVEEVARKNEETEKNIETFYI